MIWLAGLPLEILAQEFWVPGSTIRSECPHVIGKQVFQDILTVSDETACLYATRASEDYGLCDVWFKTQLCPAPPKKQCVLRFPLATKIPRLCKDFARRASPTASLKVKDCPGLAGWRELLFSYTFKFFNAYDGDDDDDGDDGDDDGHDDGVDNFDDDNEEEDDDGDGDGVDVDYNDDDHDDDDDDDVLTPAEIIAAHRWTTLCSVRRLLLMDLAAAQVGADLPNRDRGETWQIVSQRVPWHTWDWKSKSESFVF